jgi:hypothetical protein
MFVLGQVNLPKGILLKVLYQEVLLEAEFLKMFGRAPKWGDTLSGSFVEDVRAAGFDVIYAPTTILIM